MIERQKFWSMSHGFQFGRKLADWGKVGRSNGTMHILVKALLQRQKPARSCHRIAMRARRAMVMRVM